MSVITEEQKAYHLRKMKTRISRADVTGDGFISREDYQEIGNRLCAVSNLTEKQAEDTRKEFLMVADQIGLKPGVKIPLEEAARGASESLLAMKTPEEIAASLTVCGTMYDAIDTDGDGYISLPEFKAFLQVLGPDITDDKAISCFNTLDFNENGVISRDEFLIASKEFMHGLNESAIGNAFYGELID